MYQDLFERALAHYYQVCQKQDVRPLGVSYDHSLIDRGRVSTVILRAIDGTDVFTAHMEPEPNGAVWSAA